MTIDYILIILVLFGGISSYFSIWKKRVPNWLIICSVVVCLASILYYYPSSEWVSFVFSIITSIAIAVLFRMFSIWSSGDAKVFFVFSLLIPHQIIGKMGLVSYPVFFLLNAFLLLTITQIFLQFISASKESWVGALSHITTDCLTPLQILKILLLFFSISQFTSLFFPFEYIILKFVIVLGLVALLYRRKWALYLGAALSVIFIAINFFQFNLGAIGEFLLTFLLALFLLILYTIIISLLKTPSKRQLPLVPFLFFGAISTYLIMLFY